MVTVLDILLVVACLVGFYGILTFVGYLKPNISISSYSVYSNNSNSAKYKYRFCLHTVKCQNSSILNNLV